jgi:hypothetical protein
VAAARTSFILQMVYQAVSRPDSALFALSPGPGGKQKMVRRAALSTASGGLVGGSALLHFCSAACY